MQIHTVKTTVPLHLNSSTSIWTSTQTFRWLNERYQSMRSTACRFTTAVILFRALQLLPETGIWRHKRPFGPDNSQRLLKQDVLCGHDISTHNCRTSADALETMHLTNSTCLHQLQSRRSKKEQQHTKTLLSGFPFNVFPIKMFASSETLQISADALSRMLR